MSSVKKVVIIFSGIFLVSIIGMAVTLGIFFGSGNNLLDFTNIFQGHGFEVNESSSLELSGVEAIRVDATSAAIHFVPSDVPSVELKGTVIPGSEEDKYLSVSQQDGTLLIKVENNRFFFFNFMDLDLTVYLPADSMLNAEVHCTSGDLDITGMRFGSLELWRTSGNTIIRDCSAAEFASDVTSGDTQVTSSAFGNSRMTCRSGSTTVSDTTGPIYARATSGNINITNATGALDVGCTSGEVSLDMAQGVIPPITAGLTSGSIRIYMPSDAAFDLNANTTSGSISSDLDISVSGSLNQSFIGEDISGTCNGGGSPVTLTVTSGNISIIAK